jgi:hypothetical protein
MKLATLMSLATPTRPATPTNFAAPVSPRAPMVAAACAGFPLAGSGYVLCYTRATDGAGSAGVHALFWAATGLALLTAGAVFALSIRKRAAALALTLVMGVLLSLPKFLRAPTYFSFYDELAHWRATDDLLGGGRLFAENALNKVVGDYPGLHLLTAATSGLTGGSVFVAGTLAVLAARLAGCVAAYLLAERLFRSPGAGLMTVVLFAANPTFGFFDAQFAYESLALPLIAVVLLLALSSAKEQVPVAVPILLTLAVVVTHHVSSYVLAAVLAAVALARWRPGRPLRPLLLAGVATAATLVWLFAAARYTLVYIGPYVRSNLTSVPQFLTGSTKPRRLFGGFLPIPGYERVASYLSVLVLFGLFIAALWALLRRRLPGERAASWVLAGLGGLYFASLPVVALRGDQTAKRVWEFSFLGLAPLCGLALWWLMRRRAVWARPLGATLLSVVFVGCAAARSGEHIRFPGPFLPSADPRSATQDVLAAARWLRAAHGRDGKVAGDRTLSAIMGSYGAQRPITYQENGQPIWRIFEPQQLSPEVTAEVRESGVGWLAVDMRTAGVFPLTGFYFDESEPGAYVDTRLSTRGLIKFDGAHGYRRVYDNGNIVLYQVAAP